MKLLGWMLTFLATANLAMASVTVAVPEIDGSSLVTGLALFSGAALVLRGRRK